jgi:hypothetical protein
MDSFFSYMAILNALKTDQSVTATAIRPEYMENTQLPPRGLGKAGRKDAGRLEYADNRAKPQAQERPGWLYFYCLD